MARADGLCLAFSSSLQVLGVLMFYARVPLLFKWWVTSFVMSSPSYVAWLYNVQVRTIAPPPPHGHGIPQPRHPTATKEECDKPT